MMGGEYLPADLEDEIEVARIELASTTGDVIQLRARPSDGRILYRAVGESWDEGSRYAVTPEESAEPLPPRTRRLRRDGLTICHRFLAAL